MSRKLLLGALVGCAMFAVGPGSRAAEGQVDPTFLYRNVPSLSPVAVPLSSPAARYKAIFGEGDANSKILKGVSRFGELTVDGGTSGRVSYPAEESVLVVLEGSGSLTYAGQSSALRANDFIYVPPGTEFGFTAPKGGKLKVIVSGFKIPKSMPALPTPAKVEMANIADVALTGVNGHPASARYRLLMGDTTSTRDKLAAARVMISLYILDLLPGGTNLPHHHELQEEMYLLLEGTGDMVAGSGQNGIEGKYPAKPGDAYFYRANATVGFYNGAKPARILALRNTAPLGIGLLDK